MKAETKTAPATVELVHFHELRSWGINYCRSHINRLILQGRFPRPVQLNPHVGQHGSVKAWRASDLRAHLATLTLGAPVKKKQKPGPEAA